MVARTQVPTQMHSIQLLDLKPTPAIPIPPPPHKPGPPGLQKRTHMKNSQKSRQHGKPDGCESLAFLPLIIILITDSHHSAHDRKNKNILNTPTPLNADPTPPQQQTKPSVCSLTFPSLDVSLGPRSKHDLDTKWGIGSHACLPFRSSSPPGTGLASITGSRKLPSPREAGCLPARARARAADK